jgi:hypothetical protein
MSCLRYGEESMKTLAVKAVKELKESDEWDGDEERISYLSEGYPPSAPKRALILLVLRTEAPETILIRLDLKGVTQRERIDEIKKQIKAYFESETHHRRRQPREFIIKQFLDNDPEIRNWFYGTST